ncbi:MAG TPA: restriction endonuclease subunit S [Rhodocyclaceae bacterium]|nr:restriction endonuclease subunit S [Rhodocyclaceae bacterium]
MIPGDVALSVGNPRTSLPTGWRWTLLTDVARLESGHTPSRRHPEYWGGDVPWIGISDATARHGETIFQTEQNTNELGIQNSSARVLPTNTVCLSRTASVGYIVVMGRPMATSQDFVNWVCGPSLDYRFLKYALLAERGSFLRFASGTTHQTIYFPEVKAFHIALPPIETQRGIAEVLSSIDDRITLLRETNTTLASIAQAIFKSWFVDFDPVRARAEGRMPEGMDESTAALFPEAFVESQIGSVPYGWKIGTLDDLLVLQRGFDLPSKERVVGKFPIIAASGPSGTHTVAKAKAPGVVTGRSGVLGRVFLELEDYWPLNTTLWVKDFRAASPCYAFEVLKLLDFSSYNAGSAVPTLNRNHVHSLPYLIPDRACVEAYESIAMTLHNRCKANQHHAEVLTSLRDSLLPRLISGQIRTPEAKEAIADAASQ